MQETVSVLHEVTDAERWTVMNALRVAHDTYQSNAAMFRDIADTIRDGKEYAMFAPGEAGVRAAEAMADQFTGQCEEVARLSDLIEMTSRIVVVESDED